MVEKEDPRKSSIKKILVSNHIVKTSRDAIDAERNDRAVCMKILEPEKYEYASLIKN